MAIEKSPFVDLFFKHHPTRVTLDSGATGNLIHASFAQYIGAPIQNSSQTVYQADGQSSLKVIGETDITLSRDKHYFTLEALVIENIDVNVLAGVPFMTANDIAFRPSRRQILLSDGTILEYCAQPSRGAHVVRRAQACVLRAHPSATTIWPVDFLELLVPIDNFPEYITFHLDPRTDVHPIKQINSYDLWPPPCIIQSVGGKVCIPNLTPAPLVVQRNSHFCQVCPVSVIDDPSPLDDKPPPPPRAQTPPMSPTRALKSSTTADPTCHPVNPIFHHDIKLDPDNLMPPDVRNKFNQTHQDFSHVFNPRSSVYNGAVGPFEGTVNMGPTQPPQRKGHLPLYGRDKLVQLQDKFDELEEAGVFRRPEDVGISVEYVNPSFLVKKPGGGFRLVTAFADVGRYSKPQHSLIQDVDSTLHTIGQWRYIVATDLKNAFFQIPLSKQSMKYCGVATPFRGIRVYVRCAMGMLGSEAALEELMCRILGDLLKEGVLAKMLDDLFIGGDSYAELLHNWRHVLTALSSCGMSLSAAKAVVNPVSTQILGCGDRAP